MEIRVCIRKRAEGARYAESYRCSFTEADLCDWAKKRIAEDFLGEYEVDEVTVEAILP